MHSEEPANPHEEKTNAGFDQLKRRDFLKMVGGAGALMAVQGTVNLWPTEAEEAVLVGQRRNIILFTTDQQQELRWFPEGWEEANRPGLTRLRNKGVSFTRASSYKLSDIGFDDLNFSSSKVGFLTDVFAVDNGQGGASNRYYKSGKNWYSVGSSMPVNPSIPVGTAYAVTKPSVVGVNKSLLNKTNK